MEDNINTQQTQPTGFNEPSLTPSEPEGNKENNLLYFGIIIGAAILIIGGYLVYSSLLAPKTEDIENKTTNITTQVLQDKESSIETIADEAFDSEEDLDTALQELDNVDLDSLEKDLDANDSDASGFSE